MPNTIVLDKWLGIFALITSILSLCLTIYNLLSGQSTKFIVSITLYNDRNCIGGRCSCRSRGFVSITNFAKTAKSIDSVIFKLPNSIPECPELEYIVILNQPISIESEENYEIPLDLLDVAIPETLENSQKVYAVAIDADRKKWESKSYITIGQLRGLRKMHVKAL